MKPGRGVRPVTLKANATTHKNGGSRPSGIRPAPVPRPTFPFPLDSGIADDIALVLWRGLRDVQWWSRLPIEEGTGFFVPPGEIARERNARAVELAPEICTAVAVLQGICFDPKRALRNEVAEACHEIATWADSCGFVIARKHYAEAAAYADPESPTWANLAARECRKNAEYARAEIWYERAFRLV
jgi:hypothetical protein